MDLGNAVLGTETALELLAPDQTANVPHLARGGATYTCHIRDQPRMVAPPLQEWFFQELLSKHVSHCAIALILDVNRGALTSFVRRHHLDAQQER